MDEIEKKKLLKPLIKWVLFITANLIAMSIIFYVMALHYRGEINPIDIQTALIAIALISIWIFVDFFKILRNLLRYFFYPKLGPKPTPPEQIVTEEKPNTWGQTLGEWKEQNNKKSPP